MSDQETDLSAPAVLRRKALSRWDNEGGASPHGPREGSTSSEGGIAKAADVTSSEVALLRVRLIALENLLIALLTDASERQLELTRDATAYISPRPGFTPHPLTIRAASHMSDLVERAGAFRSRPTNLAAPCGFVDGDVEPGPILKEGARKRAVTARRTNLTGPIFPGQERR